MIQKKDQRILKCFFIPNLDDPTFGHFKENITQ